MKSKKIVKAQKVLIALAIGLFLFASCTKEEVITPSYDASFYEDELVFINDDVEEADQVFGQLFSPTGNSLTQGGIVYLIDNNTQIDMCVTSNGTYKFTELEYKEYSLKFDFNGYFIKTIDNIYPQNEMLQDTIF